MIIKSLSRKGGDGVFTQLFDYISAKAEPECIWHNFLDYQPGRGETIGRFKENASHIKHTPRHNICYHEILSIKRHPSRGKDFENHQIEALRDLTHQYLSARAKDQLAYAAIHLDQPETIHVHIMISSNGRESNRRARLPKHEFLDIQKSLERNLQERYPELGERTVYNKPWEQSQNLSDREQAMKKRTKEPSKKDLLRSKLRETFGLVSCREELQQLLANSDITFTERGKNVIVGYEGVKCRLKTLGLHSDYEDLLDRERDPKAQALKELERFRERKAVENEQKNIMERDQD